MLPNLRFIAASVVASVALMMFGFGMFAAFRLANQSSVVFARTGDVPPPPVFAQDPEVEAGAAAVASPNPVAETAPPATDAVPTVAPAAAAPAAEADPTPVAAPTPIAEAAPTRVPDAPPPPAEVTAAPEPPADEAAPSGQATSSPVPGDAAVAGAAEIAASPGPATAAAMPAPAEAAPPETPLPAAANSAAAPVPPRAEALRTEITGSVQPEIGLKEAAQPSPSAKAPQAKKTAPQAKKKIAKPVRKVPARRVVKRVAPRPAQPADSFSNWSTTTQQPGRQSNWQTSPAVEPARTGGRRAATRPRLN